MNASNTYFTATTARAEVFPRGGAMWASVGKVLSGAQISERGQDVMIT